MHNRSKKKASSYPDVNKVTCFNSSILICSVYNQKRKNRYLPQRTASGHAKLDVPLHCDESEGIEEELDQRFRGCSGPIWSVTHDDYYVNRKWQLSQDNQEPQGTNHGFQGR